jgi:hypothetical protein
VALSQQANIHFSMVNENRIWSSAVGIASGYGLDDQGVGVLVPGTVKNFHFSMSSRPVVGPIQPSVWFV